MLFLALLLLVAPRTVRAVDVFSAAMGWTRVPRDARAVKA